jgi:hypothetical protein
LLPLWQRVLAALGEEARYLVCLRHPVAVAASLHARNVAAPALGEALWLRHHLDILRHAGERIAAVADYDRVLAAPLAELTRIAAALGLPPPSADAAADLARPGLRHQHPATAPLFPLAGALYQALRDATPPPPAEGFEAAMALFAATPGWLEQTLAFGTSHALAFQPVQQGNSWCAALEEGFQLHPNPPEAAPPRLDWPALPLRGRHAWFHARITTQPNAWPLVLDVWLHRAGRALAGEEVPLPPGRSGPVRVDFPDVGPGEATLSLALRLHADALDNTNSVATLFRPRLETS